MNCLEIGNQCSMLSLKIHVGRMLPGIIILSLFMSAFASEPWPGITLLSPLNSNESVMIDIDSNVIMTWHGSGQPSSIAYYLPDGSILRPCKDPNTTFEEMTAGGRIQLISEDDQVVWDFLFSDSSHVQHHNIEPLPNGNVLLIAWERKAMEEAVELGRSNIDSEMWPTLIVEVEPVGSTEGNIVWQWHLWDHLIQDEDPTKPGYGVISEYPELIDINHGTVGGLQGGGDWIHANALDYNDELDQIEFSSRSFNEIYIIDHSTSSAEAASHSGGASGMGGDILYRWGNPQVYQRGTETDQYFSVVHGVNWIDDGAPGEGNILCFNNGDWPGPANDCSTVDEIEPPLNSSGTYEIESGEPFGPDEPLWTWGEAQGFYAGSVQCGAYRLLNGNTLITSLGDSKIFEVNALGETVWEYFCSGVGVARAQRYSESTGIDPSTPGAGELVMSVFPNPARESCTIWYQLEENGKTTLEIFDMTGRLVVSQISYDHPSDGCSLQWNTSAIPEGCYLIALEGCGQKMTKRVVVLR